MNYHVLARKWRPQIFSDLVGQNHVVKSLTFALENNRIHHAYLFTGTRGVGKTSIARIFAKSLNCEKNGISANPCSECPSCLDIVAGKFVDLIEVDAASRTSVDDTRDLIDSVTYLPSKARYKVYLIDEVHMFSKSSFNALLKTLEEPPEHVKFILATTDPDKLPITILSRCLQFNLKALTIEQIKNHLVNICNKEQISFDDESLSLLAKAGNGSIRDTLSITDQAIAYGQGNLNINNVSEILGTIQPSDIDAILFSVLTNNPKQLYENLKRLDGYDIDARNFLIEIMKKLQDLAWFKEGINILLSPSLQSTIVDIDKPLLHLWYAIIEKSILNLSIIDDAKKSIEMAMLRMLAFVPNDWMPRQRNSLEESFTIINNLENKKESNSLSNNKEKIKHIKATPVEENIDLSYAEDNFEKIIKENNYEEQKAEPTSDLGLYKNNESEIIKNNNIEIKIENIEKVKEIKKVVEEINNLELKFSKFDWLSDIYNLNLTDYTFNLLSNGYLYLAVEDETVKATLNLSPKFEVLLTEMSSIEIENKISNYFNCKCIFNTKFIDVLEKTPAKIIEEKNKELEIKKINDFNNIEIVKDLKENLGLKTIIKTIKNK